MVISPVVPVHSRADDDSNGAIGAVMAEAIGVIDRISPQLSLDPIPLAERILEAVADAGYGEFDGIIPAMADALGAEGLEHLKQITEIWAEQPPTAHELEGVRGYGFSSSPEDIVRRTKASTCSIILADVADAQGDVDAYMARYTAEQLTYGIIAPDVARRLIDAGRLDEALVIIMGARAAEEGKSFRWTRYDLDEVYEECLEKLGRKEELKSHLWEVFQATLLASSLCKYLRLLPDYDDLEAEKRALDHAESFLHLGAAISFLTGWPAHERAARLVVARADDLNGNAYETLTVAAATLGHEHALAATLMRRAMIRDTLEGGKLKRYRYAAGHLAECRSSDPDIEDYGGFPTHAEFVAALKQKHGRKHGFWNLVEA